MTAKVFVWTCTALSLVPVNSGITEADVIRWVGVGLGLTGAVIAGWDGAVLIGAQLWRDLRLIGLSIWRFVLRRPKTVPLAGTVTGSGNLSAEFQLRARGSIWYPEGSAEEKIELLHTQLDALVADMRQLERHHSEELSSLRQALEEVKGLQEQAARNLIRLLDQQRQEASRVDARGLPVVGWGIILAGIPDGLARWPAVGWGCVVIGFAILWVAVRAWHRTTLRR